MKHWYPRGQFDLGVGGLALLRATPFRDRSDLLAEISDRVCERAAWLTETVETEEYDFRAGYALWSDTYDSIDNPLIALEEPAIEPLLAAVPPGTALDAACGTGRLTARLVAHGHRVIGVDGSETMLDKARGRLPDVEFRRGDLLALPLPDESMELAVCGLALEHCEDLAPPVAELARVLRPEGRLLVSSLHPFAVLLGGGAFFLYAAGRRGLIRSHPHLASDYLEAFSGAGLSLRTCLEPTVTEDVAATLSAPLADQGTDAWMRDALVGLPFALIWELERA
jgi:SAM-dependent methyltransferase